MHAFRFACASFLVIFSTVTLSKADTDGYTAEELSSLAKAAPSRELFSQTCETGMLFIEDRCITAPYTISCTADTLTLNGVVYPVPFIQRDRSTEDDADFAGRRRRFANQQRSFSPAAQFARQIFRTLDDDFVVIMFAPEEGISFRQQYVILERDMPKYALFSHLLGQPTERGRVDFDLNEQQWAKMQPLLNSQPSVSQKLVMQQYVDQVDQIEVDNYRQNAAVARLDTFAYPLTIVAMVLGVFAFGHMLKWAGTTLVNTEVPNSPQAIRFVEVGLLLMLAMSSIDLFWTLLAAQAGMMQELNPIAAHFVKSPMQLTIFKLIATGIGCGILYVYRHRSQMQQATWWMCLVTVLLTFRWVVFDSMMHT